MVGSLKWSGNIGVDESTDVRPLIRFAGVRHARGIRNLAVFAVVCQTFLDGVRYVGGGVAKFPNQVVSYV